MTTRGLLGLVLWLGAGFAFTELTVLGLNAWLMNQHHPWTSAMVATATGP